MVSGGGADVTATLIVTSADKERLDYLLDSLPLEQASLHSALRAALARAEVVEPGHVPPDVVTLNSRVHFVLADPDEDMSRTLALPKDNHAESLYVSVLSPAGSALLGRRVGECVTWSGSGGETVRLSIVALTWQPERSGDLRRWKGYPANCVNAESRRTLLRMRRGERTMALSLVVLPALLIPIILCTPQHLGFGAVGITVATVILSLLMVLGGIHLLPQNFWIYGVELRDDGFIYHSPLHKARRIRYVSIDRIVALAYFDSTGEAVSSLHIASSDGNARIDEPILYRTDLLGVLEHLPGFLQDAWRASHLDEDSKQGDWKPKRTVIFQRAS
nr:GreA/GreB family elongation factor [Massilia rubra]